MNTQPLILAIDQGTTTSRAMVFAADGRVVAVAQHGFAQHYPRAGWVEHEPEEIWRTTLIACREVLQKIRGGGSGDGGDGGDGGGGGNGNGDDGGGGNGNGNGGDNGDDGEVIAIGIANQRETTVIWDRNSGAPIYNAIVWQDRRTADFCARLARDGWARRVEAKTGLLLDAYFSAPKISWILDHVDGARARAEGGELMFGTIDSFLLWRLCGRHLTDATNASRTMLFDIHRQCWDDELLRAFNIPAAVLPQVLDCAADFGVTKREWFGREIPVCGVAGDQQAALFGQACAQPGMVKCTFGSGAFLMLPTARPVQSKNRLLCALASRIAGRAEYALEGSIFNAGTAMQWLRQIGVYANDDEIAGLLMDADGSDGGGGSKTFGDGGSVGGDGGSVVDNKNKTFGGGESNVDDENKTFGEGGSVGGDGGSVADNKNKTFAGSGSVADNKNKTFGGGGSVGGSGGESVGESDGESNAESNGESVGGDGGGGESVGESNGESVGESNGETPTELFIVPAFTGLGAPHWRPHARAAIVGITRGTSKAQLVRAALEAACLQTRDLLEAMRADGGEVKVLRVDGGMAVNDWMMQFLADIVGVAVERPVVTETTALGAAYFAGLQCGLYDSPRDIQAKWRMQRAFSPRADARHARRISDKLAGWEDALARVKLEVS